MPNAADKHITFGKHKRMSKKDRQARTAAARLAKNLSQSTTSLNTALPDNPGSDADDNKENDGIDTSGPSRYAHCPSTVEEYNSAHASESTEEPEDLAEETIPDITVEALDEFDSDGYDSEEEYYR
ncbi:hypothetical protein C8R41DRAFT_923133 [Lentinula lateritia]|uniref:Uncharacterized protein n=1 Tax=Lentinula lateritia TaxID=40482 RepID=A0ABQ8V6Q0_9AGAR|nr:hypothetical protein C8R41DRAFT_923133 [Lentinula lateritia]